jgi:hypothetical protein
VLHATPLGRAERRLELAQRDRPRVQDARDQLRTQQSGLQRQLRDVDQALDALATQDEIASRARDAINMQSYVRGRIAQYLDTIEDVGDPELDALRSALEREVAELVEALDPATLRSRTDSLLRTVSSQMTEWAQDLELEHAAHGVQIDLDRLTIVADTPFGPAYMDQGEIGSGMNWVGYHLTAIWLCRTSLSATIDPFRASWSWTNRARHSSLGTEHRGRYGGVVRYRSREHAEALSAHVRCCSTAWGSPPDHCS